MVQHGVKCLIQKKGGIGNAGCGTEYCMAIMLDRRSTA